MILIRKTALLLLFFALPMLLRAQALLVEDGDLTRIELGANFNYFHANAPPGQCGCFSLYGGSFTTAFNLRRTLAIVADVAVAHANHVDNTDQNITIVNYLFGPRYTRRTSSRFVPYGQVLFGGAKEDVNFLFVINRNAFGLAAGGGVTTRLNHRFGLNLVQADYVYTRIPNAHSNSQNNIRISTGLTYHFK